MRQPMPLGAEPSVRRRRWPLATVALVALVAVGLVITARGRGGAPSPRQPSRLAAERRSDATQPTRDADESTLVSTAVDSLRLVGQAIDVDGDPVPAAQVTLDGGATTATELDGWFVFEGVVPGIHAVTVVTAESFGEERDIDLDETSEPLIITMTSGATIEVHVVEPGGMPIQGARVTSGTREAVTDATGTAWLRGVEHGAPTVFASLTGRQSSHVEVTAGDDPAVTVEVTLVLHPAATVSGRVVDDNGMPVVGAMVELERRHGDTDTETTDESGAWQLQAGAGDYVVRATADAYLATADQRIELDGIHDRVGLEVHVQPGARVVGRVIDRAGKPVAGARVEVGTYKTATSDPDGRFAVRGMTAGTHAVQAITAEGASRALKVTVTTGGSGQREVTLVVEPSTLAGVVVDADGKPVEDAFVYASRPGERSSGKARSGADGRFDLGGLPPGGYQLTASRAGQVGGDQLELHVTAPNRSVRVVVPGLATLTARVVMDGQPVTYYGLAISADVAALTSATPRAIRDLRGRFVEHNLTAGTWSILLVGPGFVRRVIEHVQLAGGRTTDLGELRVERGAVLRGHVIRPNGTPVAGATITVWDTRRATATGIAAVQAGTFTATSDVHGDYQLAGMGPSDSARYIAATHPVAGTSRYRPLAADELAVDLILQPAGGIDGTSLQDRTGTAQFGVRATRVGAQDETYDTESDAHGAFHFERLPAGTYQVELSGHFDLPSRTVMVSPSARAHVAFDLPPLANLTIEVEGACSWIDLHAGSDESASYVSTSCRDGRATFDGLLPGIYRACHEPGRCTTIEIAGGRDVTIRVP